MRGHVARRNLAAATTIATGGFSAIFANALNFEALRLCMDGTFAADRENTVSALAAPTSDLSLKVFPRAHFRKAKAAVKMPAPFNPRRNIFSFGRAFPTEKIHAPSIKQQACAGI